MNQNKKLILAAVFSSFFVGTFPAAGALQFSSHNTQIPWGVAGEGTTPTVHPGTVGTLPPIVSSNGGQVNQALPPIVDGQRPQAALPPIVKSSSNSGIATVAFPPVMDSGQESSSRRSSDNQGSAVGSSSQSMPQASLRPLRPVEANDGSFTSKAPVWSPTPAGSADSNPSPPLFPRSNTANTSGLPTHSSSGIPFYSSSSPLMLNSKSNWQDDGIVQPPAQSVLTENGIVKPTTPPQAGPTNGIQSSPPSGSNGMVTGQNYFEMPMSPSNGGMAANEFSLDCPTCGPSGCFHESDIEDRMGYFGAMSRARRYLEVDMLYLTREGDSVVLTNFGGVGAFDWRMGWRGTLGTRLDATQGSEISYFGTENIVGSVERVDPAGRLSALFVPSGVYSGGEADAFFNAQAQNELMRTRVHSLEFNRVNWAWDVVKSFVGLRYFNVDDLYQLDSLSGADVGTYRLRAKNNLVGVQIGREWFYDVGYRLSLSGVAKGGIYGNATRFRATAISNGTTFLNGSNNRGAFSTNLEFHLTGHYQITNRARFRMGYQALVLDRMVTVEDNLSGSLNPFLGSGKANRDTMFFHGFNMGFELYR